MQMTFYVRKKLHTRAPTTHIFTQSNLYTAFWRTQHFDLTCLKFQIPVSSSLFQCKMDMSCCSCGCVNTRVMPLQISSAHFRGDLLLFTRCVLHLLSISWHSCLHAIAYYDRLLKFINTTLGSHAPFHPRKRIHSFAIYFFRSVQSLAQWTAMR